MKRWHHKFVSRCGFHGNVMLAYRRFRVGRLYFGWSWSDADCCWDPLHKKATQFFVGWAAP